METNQYPEKSVQVRYNEEEGFCVDFFIQESEGDYKNHTGQEFYNDRHTVGFAAEEWLVNGEMLKGID